MYRPSQNVVCPRHCARDAAEVSDTTVLLCTHLTGFDDRQYRQAAHYNITHLRRQSFYSLPSAHIDLLSEPPFSIPETFRAVDDAIDSNADIAEAILEIGLPSFGIDPDDDSWEGKATPNDMDKARSTIRQLYRDWSEEGKVERHPSYSPLISALAEHLPSVPPSKRHKYRVLVPGAGLGRLVLEICAAGYNVEGNEISYHQLLASNYMLNYTRSAGQHAVYPWALNFSNHVSRSNQLQSVAVPDVHPATELEKSSLEIASDVHSRQRMSMTAGDFSSLYKLPEYEGAFDAVTTCFFIDTAPNLINYIERIRHCLKTGGIWVNLGPLLWHFESAQIPADKERQRAKNRSKQDSSFNGDEVASEAHEPTHSRSKTEGIGEPGAFELSDDEVVALVQKFGFEILDRKLMPAGGTGYIQDPESLLLNVYRPSFWVAKKI